MQRVASIAFLLSLGVAACSSPGTPGASDTGSAGLDSTVPHDSSGDDAAATDTGAAPNDTGAAPTDTGTAPTDTGTAPTDTGARADATGAAPGQCSPGPCSPECFRPYRCVTVCGGPVQECGCCPCAEGSIDTISCPPAP